MGDEETGKVDYRGHQPSNGVMEKLVVRESLIFSVLIEIGIGDILERQVREAKTRPGHPKRGKDMRCTVLIKGLPGEEFH